VNKIVICLFLLLCSCSNIGEEDIRIEEYGEEYAVMDCFWSQSEGPNTVVFWCDNDLETDLISGFVSLAIERGPEEDEFFSICGRDIILNSGYDLHDTLIASLTNNTYNCYNHYENKIGNEFDSLWDPELNILQIIWRPPDDNHQVLTLYIPPPVDQSARVSGTIYHKTGFFN
jgi:hypothetical protein